MASDIRISVVLPTFNREATVARAIESALAQSHPLHELLVVDDGSTDGTADAVKRFCRLDSRVKYVFQDNAGVASARNRGVQLATGDWVAFLDSDDWWMGNKLQHAVDQMTQFPEVEFIHANKSYVYFLNGEDDGREPFRPHECIDREYLLCHWAMKTSTVLIKRSLLERLGYYFPADLKTCEDYELFWRAIVEAKAVGYAPQCDTTITMTPGSMIRNGDDLRLLSDNVDACGRAARWIIDRGHDRRYAAVLRRFQYWQFRLLLTSHLRRLAVLSALRVWSRCRRELSAHQAWRALLSASLALRAKE